MPYMARDSVFCAHRCAAVEARRHPHMTHTIGTGVRAVNDTRHLPNINGAAHVDEGDTNLQLLTFFFMPSRLGSAPTRRVATFLLEPTPITTD